MKSNYKEITTYGGGSAAPIHIVDGVLMGQIRVVELRRNGGMAEWRHNVLIIIPEVSMKISELYDLYDKKANDLSGMNEETASKELLKLLDENIEVYTVSTSKVLEVIRSVSRLCIYDTDGIQYMDYAHRMIALEIVKITMLTNLEFSKADVVNDNLIEEYDKARRMQISDYLLEKNHSDVVMFDAMCAMEEKTFENGHV